MVINKQVYNGTEGWVEGMGGASQELKGADLEKMRDGAILFPELRYFGTGFQTTLEGIEAVDGRNAYRIKIIYPSGTIETEFFEISTGLKIRKTSVSEVQKQTIESITDYADYRDVSGTKFPYSIKQSGAGQVIEILFDKIEINGDLKPELFKK